eukprot:TRINITY_DN6588_c0_g1_i2.p1 TRINITY_DN6588_c0_g1~~TRINITY_DN6588_c0_g1_i2.p1  ORF type:complete len:224 (-),score=23.42 TRINITY_DN6588_c0_g1_i2:66-737(-)
MALGLLVSVPFVLYPLLFPGKEDAVLPLRERYWLKVNIWIAIFGYVGNYFWTHYFFTVLGASYSFPANIKLNGIPFFLYLITHAYFISYHTVSTIILRKFWNVCKPKSSIISFITSALFIFILSYITAFMESFTIAEVPYYSFKDRTMMYVIGSAFYGIYFNVSFPMFYRIDEDRQKKTWTLTQTAIDALAAAMLVFIFLDLCRLVVGAYLDIDTTVQAFIAQ